MTDSTDSQATDCGPACGCGEITTALDDEHASEPGVMGCGPTCGCSTESGSISGANQDTRQGPFGLGSVWITSRALKTWVSGIFIACGLLLSSGFTGLDSALFTGLGYAFSSSDILLLVGIVLGAEPFLKAGFRALRRGTVTLAVLEGVAIVVATGLGMFVEAAVLAFLINLAEVLELYAMDRVQKSLTELVELTPDTARVRRDGDETTLPVAEVAVGELLLVRPGEKIPLDGTVVTGTSTVNEAPVTGESAPADKTEGDQVYAGTINEGGYLEIEATTDAENTTIAQVARLIQEARTNRSAFEQYVDRLAKYYTPVVAGAATLVAFGPPLLGLGTWQTWFVRGLTLIVIACPCALVISTPVSVISGLTRGAKSGVLIKGGKYLEAPSQVDVVAFDKTGTLTTGDLSVTDVVTAPD